MRLRLRNYARTQPSRQWFNIDTIAGGPVKISIYDEIGFFGVSSQEFCDSLSGIQDMNSPIELYINSPGGEIFDGISIYNQLLRFKSVAVFVDGIAASAASFIAQAASPGKLGMAKNAKMMIHNGQAFAAGDAAELRKMAELLDAETENIASIYADRSGRPAADFLDMMAKESWLSATQACAEGLADFVYDPRQGPQNVIQRRNSSGNGGWVQRNGQWVFDPDGDGDDDYTADGDKDGDYWDSDGKQLKSIPASPDGMCPAKPMPSNKKNKKSNVKKPHGDVEYADPGYLDADGKQTSDSGKEGVARYPIDAEHVEAAWSYINQEDNASQYTPDQLDTIKGKIKTAMKKHGHEVAEDAIDSKLLLAVMSSGLKGGH